MPPKRRDKPSASRMSLLWSVRLPDYCISQSWASDGRRVAIATTSDSTFVLDAKTGQVQRQFPVHGFGTMQVAFHPTQPVLATAGQDGKAQLWNIDTGEKLHTLNGGSSWVEHMAWNADGSLLATAAWIKLRLWDYPSGAMRWESTEFPATISDLAWQPGTNQLAASAYGGISLFAADQATPSKQFRWDGAPLKLCWSPNGQILVQGNQDASVHFWTISDGRGLNMSGYHSKVRELSFDSANRSLATSGGSAVCVWDCSGAGPENTEPRLLEAHQVTVTAVTWQHRGFLLASGDQAGRLCLWQPASQTALVGGANFENAQISGLAWSPNDQYLLVGTDQGVAAMFGVK